MNSPVRCCMAGCKRPGEFFEPDGSWHFCSEHFDIHLKLRRQEFRARRAREKRPDPRLSPCGTHAAYERHRNHGEYPCEPCRTAESAYQKARYARRKDAS